MNNTTSIQSEAGLDAGAGQTTAISPGTHSRSAAGAGFPGGGKRAAGLALSRCGLVIAGAVGLLLTACTGVNSAPPVPVPSGGPSPSSSGPVVLGEGDVVKIIFPGAPEFSTSQKIRTDGKLSLPLIGETQAAGKTLPRLQSDLSSSYKAQLQNSEVVVSLEAGGTPVIISGAVAGPGKILIDRPTTLFEAIMGSGGFTDYAKKRQVRLIRVVNGQYHTEIYDMSQGLKGGSTPVVYLKGGDVVYVPQSNW